MFTVTQCLCNQSNLTPFLKLRSAYLLKTSETMLLCTILCGVSMVLSGTVEQDTGVKSAAVGQNVTLHCFYKSQVAMHFSWYRQAIGGRPEVLSSLYKHEKPSEVYHWLEKNPRFSVMRMEGLNHLHISDVQVSDSATYYCGSSHSNMVEFGEGVFLSVEGTDRKEIVQEPVSKTIQPGGSATVNCTVHTGSCAGEHRVYWFRHGSDQGFLHTHTEQCNPVSAPKSSSQSCVYHLQKKNLSSYDAGTYYCAVASCGEIVFGRGSKVVVSNDADNKGAKIRILVWLSIIRAGMLLVFVTICLFVFVSKTC
ncbi:uncharacterized protein LOC114450695 isoform X1 [Parambassis ranga]|uniref:Uncharacterized protein LOC114450695 isoform X1 n=1 Tax=Parambassis ranga TaxID=210632 RepID=A0A6P7K679_9TELE|nr:uncharacterized protein LOC114450695 isoform X1 [Parambassis ranga]